MENHPNCFLCKNSTSEWHLALEVHSKQVKFKRGESIFKENDPVSGFYFVHTGKVKVHKHWGDDGKDLIIKFAKEGDILGHRGLGTEQKYPVSATAVEAVSACFITAGFLQASILVNPALAYQLILFYADELQKAEQGMRDMVHMNVKSRIANSLVKLRDIFGVDESGFINTSLSRQDIASFAGTTYETVFKVFTNWSEEHIIDATGKQISITDEKKLMAQIQ